MALRLPTPWVLECLTYKGIVFIQNSCIPLPRVIA